ncbi:MAG: alpha/beta fold hydrolase, partial [Verrucomicrobia bacterium]|nr:alpha/beta fold hydrolase [Verrucomicrobiota bacterium]
GTTDFKYALHEPGGINFLYTDLTPANAGNYLTDQTTAEDLADDTLNEITGLGNGVQLSQSFLSDIQNNGKGIVLVEAGYATTYPLVLNILDSDNRIIFTNELALSISGVEDMYRWVNLRAAGGGSVSRSTDTSEPGNYPDSICNGKHFVFVHGYSVNEQQARGWNAEIFKRLYHAGSHAMFTAVTWFGNDSQITGWLPWFGDLTPNYYINVEHAFETADELDTAVSALSGQKYIAGHSLGNMLVSSAIVDHGLSVSAYFMLNAAVAMESYNPSLIYRDDMGHPDWESYSNRLWASDWHLLFDPSDGRGDLTWRGRFNGISGVRNYYSSGEDVLNNSTGAVPDIGNEYVWASEEMLKGTWLITVGPGNSEAGWGFNSDYNGLTATQANALADATLMTNSFFKHFDDEDLYGTNGSTIAQQPAMYGQLLADGIPAISYAAGRNSISSAAGSGNADMNSMENGWPTVRTSNPDYGSRWLHSDIKNIAYPYVQEVFNDIASKGLR